MQVVVALVVAQVLTLRTSSCEKVRGWTHKLENPQIYASPHYNHHEEMTDH